MESWHIMKKPQLKNIGSKSMLCMNNSTDSKYFTGKICNNIIVVPEDTKSVLCWSCLVVKMGNPNPIKDVQKSGYPRGWQFMNIFVDKDGNVYEKGILNKDLKGKYPPTEIKEKKKEEVEKSEVSFKKIKDLQEKIKKEKNTAKQTKLKNELSKLMKGMI
jgi:MoaA/NifB/PqqE/SkfB family radical SAM enzyme